MELIKYVNVKKGINRMFLFLRKIFTNHGDIKEFDWSMLEDEEVLHALQSMTTMHAYEEFTDEELSELKRLIAKLDK